MEGLQKLEEIQSMMMLLDSNSFLSPDSSLLHSDSHRFVAHFLLFLMEPCGNLSIDHKCTLISQHLPKISPSFLEKASLILPGKKIETLGDSCSLSHNLYSNLVKENTDIIDHSHGLRTEDMALIGLDAMQRANSTLEDFCRSYFMFHGLDVERPETVFKYLPVLSFTESYIYQLDTLNEKMVDVTTTKLIDRDGRSSDDANSTSTTGLNKVFETDPFRPLTLLLQYHGLLTDRIREELNYGEEYWALERRLCGASGQVKISIEDVLRAVQLKSFDYRVLNLLLYQLLEEEFASLNVPPRPHFISSSAMGLRKWTTVSMKVNDLHMEFLTVSEFLVEISDDLFDYEEDVLENNFNILRMFIRVYGASAAPSMLAKSITEAEEKYEKLSKALDPQLSSSYHKRCEEATREGGKVSGYSLGSWTIPPLIVDEELYRSNMQESPR